MFKESGPGEAVSDYYSSGDRHLCDLLSLLDTLLYLQLLKQKGTRDENTGSMKEFSHINITGEEETKIKALKNHAEYLKQKLSEREIQSKKRGIYLPLKQLSHLFHLAPLEEEFILLCLAPELDSKYEKLFAWLQDDITQKAPTVNLMLALFCSTDAERREARACFFSHSPLLRYELVNFRDDPVLGGPNSPPLISRSLQMDERIVNFLLGFNVIDAALHSFAGLHYPVITWPSVIMGQGQKERLIDLSQTHFNKPDAQPLVFYFQGKVGTGKKTAAKAFCRELNLPLLTADIKDLLELPAGNYSCDNREKIKRLFREALLLPAAVYVQNFDLLLDSGREKEQLHQEITAAINEFSLVTFLSGQEHWHPPLELQGLSFIKLEFPIPSYALRKQLWEHFLEGLSPPVTGVDTGAAADQFRFTGAQIQAASIHAHNQAMMKNIENNKENPITIPMAHLWQSCRIQSNRKLTQTARKIRVHYTWEDIVLPPQQVQQLKEICSQVKNHYIVYHEWGFHQKLSLGKGLNILFYGPSGTGKTMAAEIIAGELQLDCYKIDLSCVISKYIGETEKNLANIFKEAETSNALLFFDEADALLGKRSEVKDAHDRYANIEINYLLQKMEEHEGIVILATNFRKNIDDAFTRRMHFSVDFPFPEDEYRLQIWKKIFPGGTPLAEGIDFEFPAKSFKLSGGNIKNIALNAAFLAAADKEPVSMTHIICAIGSEYRKMGRTCLKEDFGSYFHLLENNPKITTDKEGSL